MAVGRVLRTVNLERTAITSNMVRGRSITELPSHGQPGNLLKSERRRPWSEMAGSSCCLPILSEIRVMDCWLRNRAWFQVYGPAAMERRQGQFSPIQAMPNVAIRLALNPLEHGIHATPVVRAFNLIVQQDVGRYQSSCVILILGRVRLRSAPAIFKARDRSQSWVIVEFHGWIELGHD